MTTSEQIPSVKTAVALEARRRKRVFTIFLALLAIPLAIGLYAIAKAPSETEVVAARVSPIVEKNIEKNVEENVTQRVDQKIEPRVEEVLTRRAEPIIRQTVDRQLDAAVVARVQPLEKQFRVLTQEVNPPQQRGMSVRIRELEARIAALEKRLDAMGGGRGPLTHVPITQPKQP